MLYFVFLYIALTVIQFPTLMLMYEFSDVQLFVSLYYFLNIEQFIMFDARPSWSHSFGAQQGLAKLGTGFASSS